MYFFFYFNSNYLCEGITLFTKIPFKQMPYKAGQVWPVYTNMLQLNKLKLLEIKGKCLCE